MKPSERDDRIAEIFEEALARGSEERSTFLARRCAGDADLLAEVETLLEAYEEGESQIEGLLPHSPVLPTVEASEGGPPAELGPYELLARLGTGGQGTVYLARDRRLGRNVAIKTLDPSIARSRHALDRFRREAESVSRLDHPGICTVYEVGESHGVPYMAMRYVEGETLAQCISAVREAPGQSEIIVLPVGSGSQKHATSEASNARHRIRVVLHFFERAARALHSAHEAGLVHRDIKPGNIMVTGDGKPVLLDFGLVRDIEGNEPSLTRTGDIMGTPHYMSPEQIEGDRTPLDRTTDIYSLGATLYECVTLERPFEAATREGLYRKILSSELSNPRHRNPAIPRDFVVVLEKALNRDRSRRYRTALEFAEDLRRVRQLQPIHARRTGPVLRLQRWIQRNPLASSALLVPFLLILLLVATRDPGIDGRPRRIAVLQFRDRGGAEENYVAEGITDELIRRLGEIGELTVKDRASVMPYRNSEKRAVEIGRELDVDYVLEGTVEWRKSGGSMRAIVTSILTRIADGTPIWVQSHDREMERSLDLPGEIGVSVVEEALGRLLEGSERRFLEAQDTENSQAYALYVRGNNYRRTEKLIDLRKAIEVFEQAIQLDSGFALAHAGLSMAHGHLYWLHEDRSEGRLQNAKAAADRALEMEPSLAEGHTALGYYYYWGHLDYDQALREFSLARRLKPGNAEVWAAIGFIKRRQGDLKSARENLLQALDIDPLSAFLAHNLCDTCILMRRYGEAVEHAEHAISLRPDWWWPHARRMDAYVLWKGDTTKAREFLREASARVEEPFGYLARLEILDRNYDEALALLSRMESEAFRNQFVFTPRCLKVAEVHLYRGRRDLARPFLESAERILREKIEKDPEDSRFHAALGITHAGLGRSDEAVREGQLALKMSVGDKWKEGVRRTQLAVIYSRLGDREAAIDLLRQLLLDPAEISIPLLRKDPAWDPLRDHPRFRKLVGKLSS